MAGVETFGSRVWTTREGVKMLWRDMTPKHLRNCANFLREQREAEDMAAWSVYIRTQGDAASYAMEQAVRETTDRGMVVMERARDFEAFAAWQEANMGQRLADRLAAR